MKRKAVVIQARMNSSRLPGKVLIRVCGKPFLYYQIERLHQLDLPIYIATTSNKEDLPIVKFCEDAGLEYYRGSENDVLGRYKECCDQFDIATVIRVTSDCPLIEPSLISEGISKFERLDCEWAYISNTLDRTYPRGFDFEIFSFKALNNAFENAQLAEDREHVTPYIWKNKSGKIKIYQITRIEDASSYRLTLDTPEDFTLLKVVIKDYCANNLSGEQIIDLLKKHPELVSINAHIEQKKIGE